MTRASLSASVLASAVFVSLSPAFAQVSYVDLLSQTAGTVTGTISTSSGNVSVTYAGVPAFVQLGAAGDFYYWIGDGLSAARPTTSDIIALQGGTQTITFSQAVLNPTLALVSWNNAATFSAPFTILDEGCGQYGCGTFSPGAGNLSFVGSGEAHGILQFQGTFTSLTFTDSAEYWHGFTVGITGIASAAAVPGPVAGAGLIPLLGFGTAWLLRRRKQLAA